MESLAILVVDDDAAVRSLVADILRIDGHRVSVAANGAEALSELAKHECDVIVCDVVMPGMDGPALYEQIVRRWPHLARRVIFITGHTDRPEIVELITRSEARVMMKPFVVDALRAELRKLAHPD